MTLTNAEFISILEGSKRVDSDIVWEEDEDRSPARGFRVEVSTKNGWPLFVQGRCNLLAGSLTYALILRTIGRIYGLDMGKDHHNPQCNQVGEKHKHSWSEQFRDKEAYVPLDITAPVSEPQLVWGQFCTEANIQHNGKMDPMPSQQGDIFE